MKLLVTPGPVSLVFSLWLVYWSRLVIYYTLQHSAFVYKEALCLSKHFYIILKYIFQEQICTFLHSGCSLKYIYLRPTLFSFNLCNSIIIYFYATFVGLTKMGIYTVLIMGVKSAGCMTYWGIKSSDYTAVMTLGLKWKQMSYCSFLTSPRLSGPLHFSLSTECCFSLRY